MRLPPPQTLRRALLAAALGAPWVAHAAFRMQEWPARQPAPPLVLADLEQKTWRLDAMRGQVVLLNFWATWCEPCRAEMPALEALAERHRHDGLVVLAVNFRETEAMVRRFVEQHALRLPIVLDASGAVTRSWTPGVFPTSVLVDRRGQPRRIIVGEFDWRGDQAHGWIDELLKAAP
jgi:thiol-disulfide isomerase/thioredoxin